MKKILSLILLGMVILIISSCFKEKDDLLKENFWVTFDREVLTVSESFEGEVSAPLTFHGELQDRDITVTYSIASDDAVEGQDYILPANSGTVVVPSGKVTITFPLIESLIDNEVVEPDKRIFFTLESAEEFTVGLPGPAGNKKIIEVLIKEDDFIFIAGTSFEEPATEGLYNDPTLNNITYDLVNHPGEPPVDYVSVGGELGFDATFISTREFATPNGLVNELLGVIADPAPTDAFPDGNQGYGFMDNDGLVQVNFDEVDITGFLQVFISVNVWVANESFEDNKSPVTCAIEPDRFSVFVFNENGSKTAVLDLSGPDLDVIPGKNKWTEWRADISGNSTARLVIEGDVNQNGERIMFDNIQFLGLN